MHLHIQHGQHQAPQSLQQADQRLLRGQPEALLEQQLSGIDSEVNRISEAVDFQDRLMKPDATDAG